MVPRQSSWPVFRGNVAIRSLLSPDPSARDSINSGDSWIQSSSHALELDLQSQAASLTSPVQNFSDYSIAVWNAQVQRLSKPEQEMFLKHKAGDLPEYLADVEKICKEQGDKSRAVKVAKLIKPLFDTMNMYAPVVQTMIQADPTSSALILGGITCIMSISSRFLDYQEKIVNMLSEMGEKLEILLEYGSDVYANNNQVQKALMKVFGDVLQFCSEAWHLFRHDNGEPRSSARKFITSLGKSFEAKFGEVIDKFNKDLEAFKDKALLCDRKGTKSFQSLQVQFMKHQVVETSQNYRGIIEIGQRMIATTEQGQIEDAQDRKQRQLEDAQRKKGREDKDREEKRRKLMAWLPSITFHKDQEDKFLKRLQGTGQWLLKNGEFQLWKTKPDSGLLWIYGKRGCGKSYLASRVIQDLIDAWEESSKGKQGKEMATAFAYIYCNSLDSTKIDPSKLLGSILKQLCHLLPKPEIETSLEKLYDRHSEARPPETKEIKEAIMAILGRFSQTFLVVDGLDECHKLDNDQFQDLCDFIRSLTLPRVDTSVIKAVAFSRPEYAEIKEAFTGCPKIRIDAGESNDDIRQFITTKLSSAGLHIKKNPELLAEVERSLLSGADGMFLWVDLVVNSLKGQRRPKDITATMRGVPRDLEGVYEESIRRILEKKEQVRTFALMILLWTANAKRPLSRNELLEALATEPGMRELAKEDKISSDDDFVSDCADLIVLDNNNCYQLLHSSLKDYLCAPPTAKFNVPTEYRAIQADAEKILGETCLTYLNFDTFRSGPVKTAKELVHLVEENPFFQYASTYWGRHVAAANEIELKELTNDFLSSDASRDLSMQLNLVLQGEAALPYKGKSTPLHMLSIFNLVKITKSMPEMRLLKTQHDGFLYLPLDYALGYQSRQMCNWLLERSDEDFLLDIAPQCRSPPIHVAASNDWGEVVESLIALKYDPEFKDGERQQTPLHVAACQGSKYALDALLKAHVNINAGEVDGTTPLIDAAENNHPDIAKRLLEEGAQVNIHGWNGTTALHHAAKNGDTSLAKLLIQKGADKDSACTEEWGFRTPLHLAAEEGSHEVLKLLIAEHADIEKVGPENYNALLFSCALGFSKCLTALLEAGASIDSRSDIKRTAFHMATMNGHLDILKTLFEKQPRQSQDLINADDSEGNTALHYAAMSGHTAEANFFLERGALPNKVNNLGHSALHAAIIEGETEIGKLLLGKYRANARLKGPGVSPPLHYAAFHGRTAFIRLLLAAGAEPEDLNDVEQRAIHLAVRANNLKFVEKLLEATPTLELAPKGKMGQTPLHLAAKGGFLELVQFLLRQDASSAQVNDNDGNLPLHYAAWGGYFEVVKQLLTKDNVDSPGYLRRTALFGAACSGHQKVARLLLDAGASPDLVDDLNQSPLLASLTQKHTEVANLLLERNANPKIPTRYGITALHQAAINGRPQMVKKLLDAHCDGLYLSKWGQTPFNFAIMSRNVKVVDLFLQNDINGCNILESEGIACSHRIAESGSTDILERLMPFLTPSIISHTDCIGRNAIGYAAKEGHVGMIDPLISLGIPADDWSVGLTSPLHDAVSEGHFDFVCRLVELGVGIHSCIGPSEVSPLLMATRRRSSLIAERLVRAGASPVQRDAFGLSCLDYAIRDPKTWESMGKWKATYQLIERADRIPILKKTIRKTIQAILALPEKQAPKHEFERLDNLFVLACALLHIGTKSDDDAARTCFVEMAFPSEFSHFSQSWICNVCMNSQMKGKRYECKQCFAHPLCSECYPDYLQGGGMPKSAPKSLRHLQKLENELKSIMKIGRTFPDCGAEFFIFVWQMLTLTVEWVDKKIKEYDEWEKSYNNSGRFDNYKRPGQMFLKLVVRARKIFNATKEKKENIEERGEKQNGNEEDGTDNQCSEETEKNEDAKRKDRDEDGGGNNHSDDFTTITEELSDLYQKHRPDKEIPDFICSDHEYLEIPDKLSIDETEKKYYDADGKVTNEWLSALLEKYQDSNIGSYDDQQAKIFTKDDAAQPEGTKSENGRLSEIAEEIEISSPGRQELNTGDHENIRSSSVLVELIEVNNAMSELEKTRAANSPTLELTKVSSSLSAKGMMSDETEALAGKTEEPKSNAPCDPISVDNLTITMIGKRQRLERIKQELKSDMAELLGVFNELNKKREIAAEALKGDIAERPVRQGKEGESLDKDLLGNISEENKKAENTELCEETPRSETSKNEHITKSKSQEQMTQPDEIFCAQLGLWLMLQANNMAWKLAQAILTGRVQNSLLEELSEDDERKDDKGEEGGEKEDGIPINEAEGNRGKSERKCEMEKRNSDSADIQAAGNNDADEKRNNQTKGNENGGNTKKDDKKIPREEN